ncbi:MAG: aspartate 1-decarboxylase [Candidatus Margulisbacteria bacterium]|nr:aspartate 1-decarboxylase [Candidatus Margulisiibacteriota bacterium]
MLISVLKSKINMATISDIQPYYEGSIGIDKKLMQAAGLMQGEKVHVLNFNNSHRFITYVIEGKEGEISLKGPASKLGKKGDNVIILAYGLVEQEKAGEAKAKIVHVNERNQIK